MESAAGVTFSVSLPSGVPLTEKYSLNTVSPAAVDPPLLFVILVGTPLLPMVAVPLLIESLVNLFCAFYEFGFGLASYGLVFVDFAVRFYGGYVGIDPVVITVSAAVLHDTHPRLTRVDGIPHQLEDAGGHIRVTDNVMGLADQLITSETTHLDKRRVTVANLPFQISGRNQFLVRREGFLVIRDR